MGQGAVAERAIRTSGAASGPEGGGVRLFQFILAEAGIRIPFFHSPAPPLWMPDQVGGSRTAPTGSEREWIGFIARAWFDRLAMNGESARWDRVWIHTPFRECSRAVG